MSIFDHRLFVLLLVLIIVSQCDSLMHLNCDSDCWYDRLTISRCGSCFKHDPNRVSFGITLDRSYKDHFNHRLLIG